jgi:hypothetical protein
MQTGFIFLVATQLTRYPGQIGFRAWRAATIGRLYGPKAWRTETPISVKKCLYRSRLAAM